MTDACLSCGRDTRPGTRLFSARKRGIDQANGKRGYLCQACQPGSAGPGGTSTVPLSGRYVVIDLGTMSHG